MSTQQVRKLVVIEDATVLSMAQNQTFLAPFPFLAGLTAAAKKKAGCGACGGGQRDRGVALNAAKATLAGMSADKKRTLLRLLNAEKVRVSYSDGAKTVTKTIEGGK